MLNGLWSIYVMNAYMEEGTFLLSRIFSVFVGFDLSPADFSR